MPESPLEILFEDNHCLAVSKPAGVASAHFQGEEETVDRLVRAYLKKKYAKPGNVFLGVVHRLDKPVTGVLLFARTSKAAARLSEQFRAGTVEKTYWAVVEGVGFASSGTFEDWLQREEDAPRVEVVPRQTPGARRALLQWSRRAEDQRHTLLELHPQTGRRHQLRVQLAHRGHPIVGDTRYGARHVSGGVVALHARNLTFLHPIRQDRVLLTAELPVPWLRHFAYLLQQGLP